MELTVCFRLQAKEGNRVSNEVQSSKTRGLHSGKKTSFSRNRNSPLSSGQKKSSPGGVGGDVDCVTGGGGSTGKASVASRVDGSDVGGTGVERYLFFDFLGRFLVFL